MRLLACLFALGLVGYDSSPKPAPPIFVSQDKGLTFQSPAGASHCPLGRNWVGSDHGTMLFLTPPKACGRAGYASSARNFKGDPALIAVYYGLWFKDQGSPARGCVEAGTVTLLGTSQAICNRDGDGKIVRTVWTRYSKDGGLELSIVLVTTPKRAEGDLATFRQFLASVHTCSTTERDAKGVLTTYGEGPACPPGGIF